MDSDLGWLSSFLTLLPVLHASGMLYRRKRFLVLNNSVSWSVLPLFYPPTILPANNRCLNFRYLSCLQYSALSQRLQSSFQKQGWTTGQMTLLRGILHCIYYYTTDTHQETHAFSGHYLTLYPTYNRSQWEKHLDMENLILSLAQTAIKTLPALLFITISINPPKINW